MTLGEFRKATAKLPDSTKVVIKGGDRIAYELEGVRPMKVLPGAPGGSYYTNAGGTVSALVLD
jgi:hypothetical protein